MFNFYNWLSDTIHLVFSVNEQTPLVQKMLLSVSEEIMQGLLEVLFNVTLLTLAGVAIVAPFVLCWVLISPDVIKKGFKSLVAVFKSEV